MDLRIRPATEHDIPAILQIVNYEILNSSVIYDYVEHSLEQQLEWFIQKQKDKMPVIVAEKNRIVLGFGTYSVFRPWEAYKLSLEHSIYVDKDYRSHGIGKLLMAELITLAKKEGYHTMIAGIDTSNYKSVEFHNKFGFKEIDTCKEIGSRYDFWLD